MTEPPDIVRFISRPTCCEVLACVNACKGVPTEELERVIEAGRDYLRMRDDS